MLKQVVHIFTTLLYNVKMLGTSSCQFHGCLRVSMATAEEKYEISTCN